MSHAAVASVSRASPAGTWRLHPGHAMRLRPEGDLGAARSPGPGVGDPGHARARRRRRTRATASFRPGEALVVAGGCPAGDGVPGAARGDRAGVLSTGSEAPAAGGEGLTALVARCWCRCANMAVALGHAGVALAAGAAGRCWATASFWWRGGAGCCRRWNPCGPDQTGRGVRLRRFAGLRAASAACSASRAQGAISVGRFKRFVGRRVVVQRQALCPGPRIRTGRDAGGQPLRHRVWALVLRNRVSKAMIATFIPSTDSP